MFNVNGKIYRTLPEQVEKNKDDIQDWLNVVTTLANFGIKVVGQEPTALNLPDPNTYISQGGAYGDCYLIGIEIPYDYYIFTRPFEGETEPKWLNIGQFPLAGPQGPQGVQGAQGPQGEASLWYVGTSDNPVSTNLSEGDCYLNVTNGNVYYYKNNAWTLKGNIKGPQGVQGEQGEAGATGATGAQGPQGPAGPTGTAVHVIGILSSTSELPTPTALADLTAAYLVGASSPYNLYIQVGNSVETAIWTNMGAFNVCLWELDGATAMPIEAVTIVSINNLLATYATVNTLYVANSITATGDEGNVMPEIELDSGARTSSIELTAGGEEADAKLILAGTSSEGDEGLAKITGELVIRSSLRPKMVDGNNTTLETLAYQSDIVDVEVNKTGAVATETATTLTVGGTTYDFGGGHLYQHIIEITYAPYNTRIQLTLYSSTQSTAFTRTTLYNYLLANYGNAVALECSGVTYSNSTIYPINKIYVYQNLSDVLVYSYQTATLTDVQEVGMTYVNTNLTDTVIPII